jgi:hypothetical protein
VRAYTDVKIIYPINELLAAKPYMDMYLKYDTHWNCAGGFVGHQAMLKSLGLEYTSINNCPVYEYTGVETTNKDPYYTNVWGDMISIGGLNRNDYTIDHNFYVKYRPDVVVDSRVGGNGASDTRHSTASNAPNDLNFVMLADSYRVMQLGYLEKDFSDCFLTHRSSVHNADVVAAVREADVLVIASVAVAYKLGETLWIKIVNIYSMVGLAVSVITMMTRAIGISDMFEVVFEVICAPFYGIKSPLAVTVLMLIISITAYMFLNRSPAKNDGGN